jgi:hypothetical protein
LGGEDWGYTKRGLFPLFVASRRRDRQLNELSTLTPGFLEHLLDLGLLEFLLQGLQAFLNVHHTKDLRIGVLVLDILDCRYLRLDGCLVEREGSKVVGDSSLRQALERLHVAGHEVHWVTNVVDIPESPYGDFPAGVQSGRTAFDTPLPGQHVVLSLDAVEA